LKTALSQHFSVGGCALDQQPAPAGNGEPAPLASPAFVGKSGKGTMRLATNRALTHWFKARFPALRRDVANREPPRRSDIFNIAMAVDLFRSTLPRDVERERVVDVWLYAERLFFIAIFSRIRWAKIEFHAIGLLDLATCE
jgi:hypothetical protein